MNRIIGPEAVERFFGFLSSKKKKKESRPLHHSSFNQAHDTHARPPAANGRSAGNNVRPPNRVAAHFQQNRKQAAAGQEDEPRDTLFYGTKPSQKLSCSRRFKKNPRKTLFYGARRGVGSTHPTG